MSRRGSGGGPQADPPLTKNFERRPPALPACAPLLRALMMWSITTSESAAEVRLDGRSAGGAGLAGRWLRKGGCSGMRCCGWLELVGELTRELEVSRLCAWMALLQLLLLRQCRCRRLRLRSSGESNGCGCLRLQTQKQRGDWRRPIRVIS